MYECMRLCIREEQVFITFYIPASVYCVPCARFLNCVRVTNLKLALERLLQGCQQEEGVEAVEGGELLQELQKRGQAQGEEEEEEAEVAGEVSH